MTDKLARNSAIMASGSAVSRVLGVVRASLLGAIFSTAFTGNIWQVANALPNTVFFLIAGGVLNAVLVPQITKADSEGGETGARYVDALVTLAVAGLALITVLTMPLAPLLVRLFADHGWSSADYSLATQFAWWCLPSIFFYGLYTVLGQILNARERFGAYMWAPVVCNLVWIVGLVTFLVLYRNTGRGVRDWTPGMVALLGGTMTLGVAAQALILLWPLHRTGFRYRPRFAFRGLGLKAAGTVATWTFFALLVGTLTQIVTSRVLTSIGSGDANKLWYDNAYLLFMTPQGLITVSLVTALFTGMAQAVAAKKPALVGRDVRRGMRLILATTIPVTVGMWALGPALTRVLFPGNVREITDATAYVLWAMSIALPAYGIYYLVQRAFYAFEDAKTPFRLQVVNTVVTSLIALGCYLLPSPYRAVGVALGASVANIACMVLGLRLLRDRLGGLLLDDVVQVGVRTAVACVPAGVAAYLAFLVTQALPWPRISALIALVIGGVLFAWSFVGAARRMRISELNDVFDPVLRRMRGLLSRRSTSV